MSDRIQTYRPFQERLEFSISPEEAEEANLAFRSRKRALFSAFIFFLALYVLIAIKELMRFVTIPRLHKIKKGVEHVLEAMQDEVDPDARRTAVIQLFEDWGLREFALYSRCPDGLFQKRIGEASGAAQDRLLLSKHLRTFLGRKARFLDFKSVPLEWTYFFYQFELSRIEKATASRYLLPICLGKSVYGLLFFSEGEREKAISKDPVRKELGILGLAAIKF